MAVNVRKTKKTQCYGCGNKLPANDNFCTRCGKSQKTSAQVGVLQEFLCLDKRSRIIALLLTFFLGTYGLHHFYLKNKQKGIIYLAATLSSILFVFPVFIVIGFCIFDFYKLIVMTDEQFDRKYN